MTIQYHFVCGQPGCRAHAHVTIICHDDDERAIDLDKLGAALGFSVPVNETGFATIAFNRWRCQEHAS